jgi:transcriptional regulator GlxA family with amidase domain
VTPRHLTRVFQKEIGVGPIGAIRAIRILRAAQLLVDTTRPIREIAALVGFANHYHFSTTFKSTIGVPPGEYRTHAPERTLVPPQVERLINFV